VAVVLLGSVLTGLISSGQAQAATGDPSVEQSVTAAASTTRGYRLFSSDGGIFTFGNLGFHGSLGGECYNSEGGEEYPACTDAAPHPDGNGYWIVGDMCDVYAFGSARFFGDSFDGPEGVTGDLPGAPIGCSIAVTATGNGYWLMDGTGWVAAYGDAVFLGDLDNPWRNGSGGGADITPTKSGGGYWILTTNGTVFPFGDASHHGSVYGLTLVAPVTGIVADPDGVGYWITAYDGGVFSFEAPFFGSTGNLRLNAPVNGMAAAPDGSGYWLVADDGGVFAFGDAPFLGSMGHTRLNEPVIGITPS
jgi:hypothetical protein